MKKALLTLAVAALLLVACGLNTKTAALEEENVYLRLEIAAYDSLLADHQEKNAALSPALDEARDQAHEFALKNSRLTKEASALRTDLDKTTSQIEALDADNANLSKEAAKLRTDLDDATTQIWALNAENASLSKEASSSRAALDKYREEYASLKAENEAFRTAPPDEGAAKIIADLEERLERQVEETKKLAALYQSTQNDLKNASIANAEARPPAPVDLSGFSEGEVISDLCYGLSLASYLSTSVARALVPDITQERLNAIAFEEGNAFGDLYPPTRGAEYLSISQWTYCTIPYFDEAHHERMRQLAQDRVDALEN